MYLYAEKCTNYRNPYNFDYKALYFYTLFPSRTNHVYTDTDPRIDNFLPTIKTIYMSISGKA